jgi:hypothetical protein
VEFFVVAGCYSDFLADGQGFSELKAELLMTGQTKAVSTLTLFKLQGKDTHAK